MKNTVKFLLIPVVLACAAAAQAQTAGTWMVRGGATTITPNVSSGDLTAPSLVGTKASIGSSSRQVRSGAAFDFPLVFMVAI